MNNTNVRTFIYTSFALLAFAGNSVLCRLALGESAIDAASFTIIRLLSGAIFLVGLFFVAETRRSAPSKTAIAGGSWRGAFWLFIYAATFSYAYLSLDTGMGALVLFTTVQIAIIAFELIRGQRLSGREWIGVAFAIAGFFSLLAPSASAPSIDGFFLMILSGIAWGFYTLNGKHSTNPLADTRANFIRTLPFVSLLALFTVVDASVTREGVWLAVVSGAVTSGAGYTLWYAALRGLSGVQAALLQLLVPVLATLGGIVFASEALSLPFLISSLLILGGILIVVLGKAVTEHSKCP